ncbi:type II toxin-antitoxin system RnlB family antitoxin [Caldisalinibacter kiritimatiensis]|uniref:Uncharacterized protein n=1 Tax=Caldisalinibacter kiritimatiensis TaxID=1304284 RepID=R1ATP6_9FIRM|nr:type II toxin-antitoxin system RnlB family antitoxin [Caldisalinibacter kiritimatiensis]EOD00002.1 hypothetical protein L21TH_1945 [Caldisalinibacter kiritimatiensis]
MNYYVIKKTCSNIYEYVIMSTSYINPFDEREAIEKELKKLNYRGKVLFDLLLKNGLNYNRYIEVIYNGERFDIQTCKPVENIDTSIKRFCTEFYRDNCHLLDNGILPKAQQFLIRKGITI